MSGRNVNNLIVCALAQLVQTLIATGCIQ